MSDLIRYNRIAEVLTEKDKTGKWLSKEVGKTEATISAYCTQKFQPTIYTLFIVADALEVDVRELLVPNPKSPHKHFKF